MARKKQAKGSPFGNMTFIRCELDAAEKKKLVTWTQKPPASIDDLVIEVLQANHKISYSFSEHNDSFIVSVTGKQEDCDNANKCYTSHAKTPTTALWVAMYKYHEIWQKGPWENASEESDFG